MPSNSKADRDPRYKQAPQGTPCLTMKNRAPAADSKSKWIQMFHSLSAKNTDANQKGGHLELQGDSRDLGYHLKGLVH